MYNRLPMRTQPNNKQLIDESDVSITKTTLSNYSFESLKNYLKIFYFNLQCIFKRKEVEISLEKQELQFQIFNK